MTGDRPVLAASIVVVVVAETNKSWNKARSFDVVSGALVIRKSAEGRKGTRAVEPSKGVVL